MGEDQFLLRTMRLEMTEFSGGSHIPDALHGNGHENKKDESTKNVTRLASLINILVPYLLVIQTRPCYIIIHRALAQILLIKMLQKDHWLAFEFHTHLLQSVYQAMAATTVPTSSPINTWHIHKNTTPCR